jgi:hypothetical protein
MSARVHPPRVPRLAQDEGSEVPSRGTSARLDPAGTPSRAPNPRGDQKASLRRSLDVPINKAKNAL